MHVLLIYLAVMNQYNESIIKSCMTDQQAIYSFNATYSICLFAGNKGVVCTYTELQTRSTMQQSSNLK